MAGVIDRDDFPRLQRLIFRTTKGKAFVLNQEIPHVDGQIDPRHKSVYIITLWDTGVLKERIQKLCDSFPGERFEVSRNPAQIEAKIRDVTNATNDARKVLTRSRQTLRQQLQEFDRVDGMPIGTSSIYIYKMFLAREKSLYLTLNMMKWQDQTFTGFFWAPINEEQAVDSVVRQFTGIRVSVYPNHRIT